MDVIHEWKIDRFGKLDWQPKSGWVVNETPDMSLKILSSRKLVISSSDVIVVSIIIIPWSSWIVIVASCFKHISIKYMPAYCHTFGVFLLIFGLNNRFVTQSLIVTHLADLPLFFEKLPLILMTFATHFCSYWLRGCEIWLHQNIWNSDHTFWKILVGKSVTSCYYYT